MNKLKNVFETILSLIDFFRFTYYLRIKSSTCEKFNTNKKHPQTQNNHVHFLLIFYENQ